MIEENLASLGILLPTPPKPAGSYIPVVRTGNLIFVSGQIPMKDGQVQFKGQVPTSISIEDAQKAAKLCITNVLAQIKAEIGTLDKITKIVKVSGFVNSSPEFYEHPKIINAASDLLFAIFGEKGKHARIAVGVASLPLNSAVEIDLVAETT
ncbi:RidA family protein [Candidatus Nitrosotalea okcheonensis]|uniref:Endoribonuclease L-PSP n=1 Tax=Candidatus Nitrosotalea okcheonensis TaxID=1903276 RepID=A0A2H1FDW5_9ARCH|nr:RidA family protein [Candidatus Nitrosotalea okcheonensis]SMH70941.1 Endoribonuclease L-PSP [Candidatus Nitrosotalea okcheonensis]